MPLPRRKVADERRTRGSSIAFLAKQSLYGKGNAGWGTLIRPPSPIYNKKINFHQSQLFDKKLFLY
jgi:hypothetical protein